ncbi:hypothetical protein RO3G_06777 [Lichtheimia corymbifera JMRC:FSU:9682]|uniref:Uncharacterized protein n=1 Tax=Lichtheimia corymbifera JMRC:FSU:9682 TaxID=1263082 RepID=A0A068S9E8_9FUNG|nr:hypothetical protein RO3G_06777 [Lichtheimia corymbifera JMRC:FSU:9682]
MPERSPTRRKVERLDGGGTVLNDLYAIDTEHDKDNVNPTLDMGSVCDPTASDTPNTEHDKDNVNPTLDMGSVCDPTASDTPNTEHDKDNVNPTLDMGSVCDPTASDTPPSLPPKVTPLDVQCKRDERTAVLAAMDRLSSPEKEQDDAGHIAALGGLIPVGLYIEGTEHNLLAASKVATTVVNANKARMSGFHYASPMKSAYNLEQQSKMVSPYDIAITPMKTWMMDDQYVEMDQHLSTILNTDWNRKPWLRYVIARMMEGLILVEKGMGVMVLCAEVYGRIPEHDAHHERIRFTKGDDLHSTSLPQQGTRYPNIEVKRLYHDNSSKLVIGTKVLNVLVTSSARLDCERLSLGASNTNGFDPSRHTAIYVTQEFLDWYKEESFDSTYKQLYSFDELSQLKQVRSKFDCPSTYLRCRSSSKITNDLRSRPATIWTVADFDLNATPSAASLASTLFRHIATEIMKDGAKATLLKSNVSAIHKSLKEGKTKAIFSKIMQLFGTKDNQLILGNTDLNTLLTELASTLSSQIKHINDNLHHTLCAILYNHT